MNDLIPYNADDLHDIHTMLGADAVETLKLKALAVAHFMRAKDKRGSV